MLTPSSLMNHVEVILNFVMVLFMQQILSSSFLKKHILYKVFNNADDYDQNDDPSLHSFHTTTTNNNIEYTRSINCSLLTQSKDICLFCNLSFKRKYVQNKNKKILVPC